MRKRIERVGAIVAVVGCMATMAFAQGGVATFSGTVFDQAKAVLPGATVTVTNEATGISREAVTGPEGQFVVPTLMPGTYTVRAELAGFPGTGTAGPRASHRAGGDTDRSRFPSPRWRRR